MSLLSHRNVAKLQDICWPGLFYRFAPPIIWAGVIFMISSVPDLGGPDRMWFRVLTSFAHFVEYVILAVLVHTGITGKSATTLKESNTTYAAIAWAIAVVYATSDEIHQSFIPGRDSSILDFGIDAVGVFIGIFAIPAFVKWLQNKLQKQTKTQ